MHSCSGHIETSLSGDWNKWFHCVKDSFQGPNVRGFHHILTHQYLTCCSSM